MMLRGLKKYKLDDDTVVDAREVSEIVGCSVSLARERLNSSSIPNYIYMPKGKRIAGGHSYVNKIIKKSEINKNKPVIKTHYAEGGLIPFFDPMFKLAMKVI